MRQHGGEIGVDSQPNGGARFTVSLPLETTFPLFLDAPSQTPPPRPVNTSARGTRVLVVEDETIVARLMQEIFRTEFNCEVDVVTNGVAAFEKLAITRYALVVADVRMPKMTGTELYLWLREAQPAAARRFVFVTGHAGEKHLEAEIAQLDIPVISKPFTIEQITKVCAPFLQAPVGLSA